MKNNLSDVEQRVKRYWYTDGIGELMGGGMSLVLGLYFALPEYLGEGSLLSTLLQSSLILVLIGDVFLAQRLINIVKTRLTYPRTGYVEYRSTEQNSKWRRILVMAVAMLIAMLSLIIARRIDAIDSMVAVTGVLVAVILTVKQAWSSRMRRFYILSAVSLILGFGLSLSGLAKGYNLGLFYGLMGIAFAVSGGLTLQRYLRENPIPVEAENE